MVPLAMSPTLRDPVLWLNPSFAGPEPRGQPTWPPGFAAEEKLGGWRGHFPYDSPSLALPTAPPVYRIARPLNAAAASLAHRWVLVTSSGPGSLLPLATRRLAHSRCQEESIRARVDPRRAPACPAPLPSRQALGPGALTCMPRQTVLSMMRANIRYSK